MFKIRHVGRPFNLIVLVSVALLFYSSIGLAQEQKKSVNEKILDILVEKDAITQDQYQTLKNQARAEEQEKKAIMPPCACIKNAHMEKTSKLSTYLLPQNFINE